MSLTFVSCRQTEPFAKKIGDFIGICFILTVYLCLSIVYNYDIVYKQRGGVERSLYFSMGRLRPRHEKSQTEHRKTAGKKN